MQQRDIILDQAEQAGKVLAQLLSKFLLIEGGGITETVAKDFSISLKGKLDIDLSDFLSMDQEALENYFESRFFSTEHIYLLGKKLVTFGEQLSDPILAKGYFEKGLRLLRLSDELSGTYSIQKSEELKVLEQKLKEI